MVWPLAARYGAVLPIRTGGVVIWKLSLLDNAGGRVALLAVICTSGPRFSLPLCGTDTHYTRAQGCMQPGRAIIRVLLLTLAGLFAPAWHHDTTTPGHQDTTTPAPPPRPHRRKFFIFPSLPSATTGPTPAPSATSPLPPPPPEQPQTTPHLQKGPTERSEGGSTISDSHPRIALVQCQLAPHSGLPQVGAVSSFRTTLPTSGAKAALRVVATQVEPVF